MLRKYKVYVVNSDTIIVAATKWEIPDPNTVCFYYNSRCVGVFRLDNIQGFKEVE